MNLTAGEERNLYTFLREARCCLRCCLRFIGSRTPEYYQDPISIIKKLNYVNENEEVKEEDEPCTACLGILQDVVQETAVQKIVSEINRENYDCATFTCALTIPITVQLRERSLHIYLEHKFKLFETILCGLKYKTQSVKDVWKWLVAPKIELAVGKRVDLVQAISPFIIDIFLVYSNDEDECKSLLNMCGNMFKERAIQKRKYNDGVYSRKSVESAMISTTDDQFVQHFMSPPLPPMTFVTVEKVTCTHTSIFIGGRYNKFSRELSQTPWFINGEKKMETSVQELLCDHIVKFTRANSMKFLSSGREDVDVRTIHSGRPFAVELLNPRITKFTEETLANLVSKINECTEQVKIVSTLKVLSKADLRKLKEGENTKTKLYRALCVCRTVPKNSLQTLNQIQDLKIIQKTPVRVLHRRPLTPRTRIIHTMRARWIRPEELKVLCIPDDNISNSDNINLFILDVKTQAGTYVKEFVHGDFGRTQPSLCELLDAEVDIIALDVTSINLDWP